MRTMTVGELREFLTTFPEDMGVVVEWEGQYIDLAPSEINREDLSPKPTRLKGEYVVICADSY